MKKVANLILGGIQQKIFNLVLYTILLVVAAYTVVTFVQANRLLDIVQETNAAQTVAIREIEAQVQNSGDTDCAKQINDLLVEYEQNISDASDAVTYSLNRAKQTIIVFLVIALVLSTTGALYLAWRIVKPLETITKRIAALSGTNLEFKMEDAYRTGDEIQVLAESFATLSHKTVTYVEEVKRVTAEKERIGAELNVATQIQAGMLPNIFPAFPDREEFDIYATMTPAKEVGGDFYDFFLIDEDHLAMVMADVSGKGVPAALFMMASKILINDRTLMGGTPAEILEFVNRQICKTNEAEMFVTVWLGILDIRTGHVIAANAGHEFPAFKKTNGKYELIHDKHGFVVGGMDGVKYKDYAFDMERGASLFVYTDGVPEATDAENGLYGTERMLDALNRHPDAAPEEILKIVHDDVDNFVKEAPQFDDLTMLCVKYLGKDNA